MDIREFVSCTFPSITYGYGDHLAYGIGLDSSHSTVDLVHGLGELVSHHFALVEHVLFVLVLEHLFDLGDVDLFAGFVVVLGGSGLDLGFEVGTLDSTGLDVLDVINSL
jgi:hypothetical protein